ncbi:hypothetical protein [Arthrobacter sp. AL12]|nr:hypothetical protein [Arthrobacter sp. AL12]MDI3210882.1 hypothetical protein [Arthrobacter sp. AL12]
MASQLALLFARQLGVPVQLQGGLTPMLDLSGASRRVWGKEFHPGPGFTE